MVPYLLATCVMASTPECSAPINGAVFARDEALGNPGAGGGLRFSVGRDPYDLAAEHATFGVNIIDRHTHGAQFVLPTVAN